MPGDVPFPRPEKYELEDQNEDANQSGERRISNDNAVYYDYIGILNEAMQR